MYTSRWGGGKGHMKLPLIRRRKERTEERTAGNEAVFRRKKEEIIMEKVASSSYVHLSSSTHTIKPGRYV